jgi:hypothetical protein
VAFSKSELDLIRDMHKQVQQRQEDITTRAAVRVQGAIRRRQGVSAYASFLKKRAKVQIATEAAEKKSRGRRDSTSVRGAIEAAKRVFYSENRRLKGGMFFPPLDQGGRVQPPPPGKWTRAELDEYADAVRAAGGTLLPKDVPQMIRHDFDRFGEGWLQETDPADEDMVDGAAERGGEDGQTEDGQTEDGQNEDGQNEDMQTENGSSAHFERQRNEGTEEGLREGIFQEGLREGVTPGKGGSGKELLAMALVEAVKVIAGPACQERRVVETAHSPVTQSRGRLLDRVATLSTAVSADSTAASEYRARYTERHAHDGCTESFPLFSSERVRRQQQRASKRETRRLQKQVEELSQADEQLCREEEEEKARVQEELGGEPATCDCKKGDAGREEDGEEEDGEGSFDSDEERSDSEDEKPGGSAHGGAEAESEEEDEAEVWRAELGRECAAARQRRQSNAGEAKVEVEQQLKLRTGTSSLGDLGGAAFGVRYNYVGGAGNGISLQDRLERKGKLCGAQVPSHTGCSSIGGGARAWRRRLEEEQEALVAEYFKGDDVHPWTQAVEGKWVCKRAVLTKAQLRKQLTHIFLDAMAAEAKAGARRRELDRFARSRKGSGSGGRGSAGGSKNKSNNDSSDGNGNDSAQADAASGDGGAAVESGGGGAAVERPRLLRANTMAPRSPKSTPSAEKPRFMRAKTMGGSPPEAEADPTPELVPSAVPGVLSEDFGIARFVVEWTRTHHHRFVGVVKKGKKAKKGKPAEKAPPPRPVTGHRGALRETLTGDLRLLKKSVLKHMGTDDLVMLFARCCRLTASTASVISAETLRPCFGALAQCIALSMQDGTPVQHSEGGDSSLSDGGGSHYPWGHLVVGGAVPMVGSKSALQIFSQHLVTLATKPAPPDAKPAPGYSPYAPISERLPPAPQTIVDRDFIYQYTQKFNTFCTSELAPSTEKADDSVASAGGKEAVPVAALLLLFADSAIQGGVEGGAPVLRKHRAKKKKKKKGR